MAFYNKRLGEIIGPFPINQDLLAEGGAIDIFTPESTPPILTKVGIIAPAGTKIQINDAVIRISATGIFEIDSSDEVAIKKLIFLTETNENSQVDFTY